MTNQEILKALRLDLAFLSSEVTMAFYDGDKNEEARLVGLMNEVEAEIAVLLSRELSECIKRNAEARCYF